MSQENHNGLFLASFIIGGLVGSAVTLLVAPQTGEKTRLIILQKSSEVKEKATNSASKVLQSTRTQADELTNMAKEKVSQLRNPALLGKTEDVDEPDSYEVELDETVAD